MTDVKTEAKNVVKLGRIRSRLIEQRTMWRARRQTQPEAAHILAQLDRDLEINAGLLRAAKEALARAKKAPPPAGPASQ